MADAPPDLYRRLEIEVRTPQRRLAVDAFLPDPAALPSAVAAATPPPVEVPPDEAHFFRRRDEEPDEPPPPPRPKKKPRAAAKKEGPKSLQEEIAEFMSRDRRAYAPDEDLDASPPPAPAGDRDKPGGGDDPGGDKTGGTGGGSPGGGD